MSIVIGRARKFLEGVLGVVVVAMLLPSPAVAQPIPIVLKYVALRGNKPPTGTVLPTRGLVRLEALVNNNDYASFGLLEDDLVAGNVSINVTDAGSFNANIPVTQCRRVRAGLVCRDAASQSSVLVLIRRQLPLHFRLIAYRHGIDSTETGEASPLGDVTVTLNQSPAVARPDAIGNCVSRQNPSYLFCRN